MIGGPFLQDDTTPLAIHKQFFERICPQPTILDTEIVRRRINNDKASALTILNAWVDYIKSIEDPCVEIGRHADRVFDY